MTFRASLVLLATLAFAASPFLVPGFGGYEPSQFPVPLSDPSVQPAGYAFSIWGPIYLWLLASAGFGLWRRRGDAGWDAARWPLAVSVGIGAIWLPVALASPIWATVLIWGMLGGALLALLRAPSSDRWLLTGPIGLYAGWLTAASAVSIGLVAAGWGLPPLGPDGWAVAALSLGLAVALAMLRATGSATYAAAMIWALIAVTMRNGVDPVGLFAMAAAALVAAVWAFWRGRARPATAGVNAPR
jgi:hypothetical protein